MVGEKPARMVCYCKWLSGKEYMGSIPGSGRSPGEGNGNPYSIFLPEKHHGQRSLAGYSPWGHKRVRHARVEDWTCLGQHKRQPEFPVVTREKPRGSPVIARWSPFPLQRLRRSPTLGIGGRNGTWYPWCDPQSAPTSRSPSRGTPRFSGSRVFEGEMA